MYKWLPYQIIRPNQCDVYDYTQLCYALQDSLTDLDKTHLLLACSTPLSKTPSIDYTPRTIRQKHRNIVSHQYHYE